MPANFCVLFRLSHVHEFASVLFRSLILSGLGKRNTMTSVPQFHGHFTLCFITQVVAQFNSSHGNPLNQTASHQYLIVRLSLSFRLELIPPSGGVSHADPPSPLVCIISVFFL